jgi:uncharacterized membrane-anchored protein YhcB (DUF1043 family)
MLRIQNTLPIAMALLLGPLMASAQDQQQVSLSQLHQIVLEQQKTLDEQKKLLDEQTELIRTQAQSLQSLKAQVDQMSLTAGTLAPELSQEDLKMQERLRRVEEQIQRPPDTPEDVLTAGEFPGSIRIPGTNMAGKMGGFVRLGVVDSLDPIGSEDRFVVGTIPVGPTDSTAFNEGFVFSAKRSRLNLDMRMDSSVGQFRAFVEGDFAGAGGTDNYRLRHAYGQYNRVLLGQTWSTLMDTQAVPEELDFEGLNAQIQERQPLFRWTKGTVNQRTLAVGFEDPSPEITGGDGISNFPDFSFRVTQPRDWGHLQGGILLRQIVGELQDTEKRDKTFGWALTGSGNLSVKRFDARDNLKFQLSYGKGLGRYVNDLDSVGGLDAVFDPEGQLRAYPVFAGYLAYQHWWRRNPLGLFKDLRSTIVAGYVDVDSFDFEADDAYNRTFRNSLNLIWSPITAIDLGVEFLYGKKWTKDGESGKARQLQAMATFRF